MKKNLLVKGLTTAFIGSLFVAGTANALFIDFTSSAYSGIEETTVHSTFSTTTSGLTISLNGNGDKLTFNSGADAPGTFTTALGVTFAGLGDGIGLNDDEIGGNEILTVSFSPDVTLKAIYLLDLFANKWDIEIAKFDISPNGGVFDTWGLLTGTTLGSALNPIGFVSWSQLPVSSVLSIDFTAIDIFTHSDFALAGLDVDVAPVPEPASMLLFGTGLAGVASLALRKKKKLTL